MIDINKAKQKILDMAIRGKLTKQLKSDGNAADLLVEIQKVKEKQNTGARKTRPYSVGASYASPNVNDDLEMPFEIPENWVWCRASQLLYLIAGTSYNKTDIKSDGIRILRGGNIVANQLVLFEDDVFVSDSYQDEVKNVYKGDIILVASTGSKITIGKPARILVNHHKTQIGAFLRIARMYKNSISNYIWYIFNSSYYKKHILENVKGTNISNIKNEYIEDMLIPLPPLAEQNRIVEKVDKLFEILDKIDEAQKKYQKDKEILKSKIIEAGIRGKLTKQLKTDGNATDLLDEIRKEKAKLIKEGKIKRDKKETYIYKNPKDNLYYEKHQDGSEKCINDELPFEIPENWVWCRLGNIGRWGSGATPLTSNSKYYDKGTIPWILTGDLNDSYILTASHYITEKALNDCSLELREKGSVLIAMYGATIGKLAILEIDATMNQACCACTVHKGINNKWLYFFLMCNKTSFVRKGSGGAQPNISKEKITQTEVPLPPHAEQERIVEQIEELLTSIVS